MVGLWWRDCHRDDSKEHESSATKAIGDDCSTSHTNAPGGPNPNLPETRNAARDAVVNFCATVCSQNAAAVESKASAANSSQTAIQTVSHARPAVPSRVHITPKLRGNLRRYN
jgi:hypothetical protein